MKLVELILEKNIATVWLNRPEVHNAFNMEMIDSLIKIMSELNDNKEIRAIVFRGRGKSFSSGADLNYMKKVAKFNYKDNLSDARKLAELFYLIYSSQKFTLSVVHGFIGGGANGIVAACDFVLAEKQSKFRFSELRLGLIPATISPYVLHRCGYIHSLNVMLSAETFSAKKAKKIALINKVTCLENLEESLAEILLMYLSAAPSAMIQTKKMLQQFYPVISPSSIDETAELLAKARSSQETGEGINAFFEKRKPEWLTY